MNIFDAVIAAFTLLAIVMGFSAGLLRRLATILGYLIAAPLAVALAPYVIPFAFGRDGAAPANAWVVVVLVFVALGIAISALLRVIVDELAGDDIGPVRPCRGRSSRRRAHLSDCRAGRGDF